MADFLLLIGLALMALSVLIAVFEVARTEPPRAAASAFVLGLIALVAGAWADPDPFRVQDIARAWSHLIGAGYMR